MDQKGIEEFYKLHAEHLENALAYARQSGIPEEFVRSLFNLMVIHVLMTCPNAPRTHFADGEERNRYIALFIRVSDQEAGCLYGKYLAARAMYPHAWPDLSEGDGALFTRH